MPEHLKKLFKRLKKGSLTRLQWFYESGSMNLERRIYDLRQLNHDIPKKMISRNGKRYAQYRLV